MGPLIQAKAFTHMYLLPSIRYSDANGYLTRPTLTLDPVAVDWTQEVGVQPVGFLNLSQEFSDIQHLPGVKKHITESRSCQVYLGWHPFKRKKSNKSAECWHKTSHTLSELREDRVTLQCDLHRAATTLKVLTLAQGCNKMQQPAESPGSWHSSGCQLTQTMHQNPLTD